MKTKTPFTKLTAVVLCIVTLSLAWNIYLSYRELYYLVAFFSEATAMNSEVAQILTELNPNYIKISHYNHNLDTSNIQRSILLNLIYLLLSFVILASLQNLIHKLETKIYLLKEDVK